MKTLCVYCGSATGVDPNFATAARELADELARQNIGLVYGGGNNGLMGILADQMLKAGGEVTGVIPKLLLELELGHKNLTHLHVVNDMHERKALMAKLSDGFVALPGGIGTLEELFEMLTWRQIGFHGKPVGLLNVQGFYDGLLSFLNYQVMQGFLQMPHRKLLVEAQDAKELIALLKQSGI